MQSADSTASDTGSVEHELIVQLGKTKRTMIREESKVRLAEIDSQNFKCGVGGVIVTIGAAAVAVAVYIHFMLDSSSEPCIV